MVRSPIVAAISYMVWNYSCRPQVNCKPKECLQLHAFHASVPSLWKETQLQIPGTPWKRHCMPSPQDLRNGLVSVNGSAVS